MKQSITVKYEKFSHKYRVTSEMVGYHTLIEGRSAFVRDPVSDQLWARLFPGGALHIFKGAPWNGPSGPTIDTPSFMDASLAHDYLYTMIEQGSLPMKPCRRLADKTMRRIAKEHGMGWFRRLYTFLGVRVGGKSHAK